MDPLADHPNQIALTPYNFTWNNPVNLTDPDGRCPSCPQGEEAAELYADGAQVENQDGSWTWTGSEWTENTPTRSEIWKDTFGDNSLPDANIISFGGDITGGTGFGYEFQVVRINKGEDKGWHFYSTNNANIGLSVGGGITFSNVRYNKNNSTGRRELRASDLEGLGNNYSASLGVIGAGRGYTTTDNKWTTSPTNANTLYTTSSFSVGPEINFVPLVGGMWQGSHSKERFKSKR